MAAGWLAGGAAPKARAGRVTELAGARPRGWRASTAARRPRSPVIGVLLYSAFIWYLTGDPLSWAEGHVAWGRSYQGLSILVTERYQFLSRGGRVRLYLAVVERSHPTAGRRCSCSIPVWPVARRLGLAYAVFILINILPPLAAGGCSRRAAFHRCSFPAFIWFASVVPERHRTGWLTSFMAFQALNAALFYTWREMYYRCWAWLVLFTRLRAVLKSSKPVSTGTARTRHASS